MKSLATHLRHILSGLAVASTLAGSTAVQADWHFGTVASIGIAYDAATVTLQLAGWSRSNCTCYGPWNTHMCLDSTRATFKLEYAAILGANLTGQEIGVNIDETTCRVVAFFKPV